MYRPVLTGRFRWLILFLCWGLVGCSVQYRSQVETEGRSTNYQYGPGSHLRYDGYDNVAGDLEGSVTRFRVPSGGGEVLLLGMPRLVDLETVWEIKKALEGVDIAFHVGTVPGTGNRKTEDLLFEMVGSVLELTPLTALEALSDLPWRVCLKEGQEADLLGMSGDPVGRISRALERMKAIGKPMLVRFPVERFQDFLKHQYARSLVHSSGSPIEGLRQFTRRVRVLLQGAIRSWPQAQFVEIDRLLEGIERDLGNFGGPGKGASASAIFKAIESAISNSTLPVTLGVLVDTGTASTLSKMLIDEGFEGELFRWFDVWRLDARVLEEKR